MNEGFFPTYTAIRREDLTALGFDGDALTDCQMRRLARRMGDIYLNRSFWMDMRIAAWQMHVPVLDTSKLTLYSLPQ